MICPRTGKPPKMRRLRGNPFGISWKIIGIAGVAAWAWNRYFRRRDTGYINILHKGDEFFRVKQSENGVAYYLPYSLDRMRMDLLDLANMVSRIVVHVNFVPGVASESTSLKFSEIANEAGTMPFKVEVYKHVVEV